MSDFSDLNGKILTEVRVISNEIVFKTEDKEYRMYHEQDCCEDVSIESITGDIEDLLNTPIRLAEEAVSTGTRIGHPLDQETESQTWTFYKLRTIKGSVDIRWYGTSNGYYSESVSFKEIK